MPKKTKKTSKVAKSVKTYVKKALDERIEDKFALIDYASLTPTVNGSNSFFLLNHSTQSVQGSGGDERIGDQILNKSVEVRIAIYGVDAVHDGNVRFILFRFKDPNSTAPIVGYLMTDTAGAGIDRPLHAKSKLSEHVEVLMDKTYAVQCIGNITAESNKNHYVIKRKLNFKTRFNRGVNLGTIADIQTNALYLWVLPERVNATGLSSINIHDVQVVHTWEDA